MGATHLMKTLPKVAAEMALHVLAYTLTRVMNIIGIKPLMAAIRVRFSASRVKRAASRPSSVSSTLIDDQDNLFLVWIDDGDLVARIEVFARTQLTGFAKNAVGEGQELNLTRDFITHAQIRDADIATGSHGLKDQLPVVGIQREL